MTIRFDQVLVGAAVQLLGPLTVAAQDDASARAFLEEIGWNADALDGVVTSLRAACADAEQLITDVIDLFTGNGDPSLDAIIESLQKAADLVSAVLETVHAVEDLDEQVAELLPQDIAGALLDSLLRAGVTRVRAVAVLTGLIDHTVNAEHVVGGVVVRRALPRLSVHPERLRSFLQDPVAYFRNWFRVDGASTRAADLVADLVGPLVVDAVSSIGTFTSQYSDLLPGGDAESAAVLAHMLFVSWQAPDDTVGSVDLHLVAGLVDEADGTITGVINADGEFAITRDLGIGQLSATATVQPEPLKITAAGIDPVDENAAIDVRVAATLDTGDSSGAQPVARIGAATGPRVQVDALHATVDSDTRRPGFVAVSIGADLRAVLQSSDGFLAKVLPAKPVNVASRVNLDWSPARGLRVTGGDGLRVDIPVGLTLGPVTVHTLHVALEGTTALSLSATADIEVALGPLGVSVAGLGFAIDVVATSTGGSLGPLDARPSLRPPAGAALTITAPVLSGGGFLLFDQSKGLYAGGVQLALGQLSLAAVGVVVTRNADGSPLRFPDGSVGYSLVVVIAATFPPIQVGLGFALAGVGGLLGYNRTLNIDALRAGVRSKALDSLLFPSAPAGNADRVVSTLSTDFPVALGRLVVGPMVRLTWGEPVVATIDLAVLVELPAPVRVTILGRLRMALPRDDASAVIRINLDAVGVADFGQGSLSLDATVYDSRIGAFALAGDMALRLNWKGQRRFLLSIGGWHPAYTAPPDFPALRRITLSLTGTANVQFSVAAYFAVTSNTVQFGGRADVKLSGGGATLTGMIALDTLITLNPFGIRVDFAAALAISFEGVNLLAVAVSGTLSGPGPWHVHATATVTLLGFSCSVLVDTSFGPAGAVPAAPAAVDVLDRVRQEVGHAANWQATPTAQAGLVRLADVTGDGLRVSPLSTLAFHQRVAPLGVAMTRFGPAPLTGARSVSVHGATIAGTAVAAVADVVDDFAPATFLDLTDAQRLASPAFVSEPAGATLGAVPLDLDDLGAADVTDLRSVPDFTDPIGEAPLTAQGRLAARRVTSAARPRVAAPTQRRAGVRVRPRASAWPLYPVGNG